MNRRGFLQLLGTAAVGLAVPDLTLDAERALWVPGAKRIFDLGGVQPADLKQLPAFFLTPDWVTREALKALRDKLDLNLAFTKGLNRTYADDPARVGFTVNVRLPDRFGPDGRPQVVLRPGEEFITITPR